MVQLGFVIDHSRCIGCHACTVACKSENDVPVGSFRTWVKYTEAGAFPDVRRSFAVLRCNQCSDAPCVTICPVTALAKRPDGIVDLDQSVCIGCKGCMQACPYDALYINDAEGTAEKCHFCAHRTELGLAPACAVVCPTEAIVPGDFDDPRSAVSRLKAGGDLTARKPEAGTRPNVWYRDVDAGGVEPLSTNGAGGYLWSDRAPGPQLDAETFRALEEQARARTVYDVPHAPVWGGKVSAYLLTKSIAAGVLLAAILAGPLVGGGLAGATAAWTAALALLFLAATAGLLIGDLKRPDRFLSILLRPNWSSWIAKGTLVLTGYGVAAAAWLAVGALGVALPAAVEVPLLAASGVLAVLTASYTAWLFRQAAGRVLWMKRYFALHLAAQAVLAGCATLLLLQPLAGLDGLSPGALRAGLVGALLVHVALLASEHACAPRGREREFARAARLVSHGPFARRHWWLGVAGGVALPLALLGLPFAWAGAAAGALALAGLFVEEDILVRAGQSLPIS